MFWSQHQHNIFRSSALVIVCLLYKTEKPFPCKSFNAQVLWRNYHLFENLTKSETITKEIWDRRPGSKEPTGQWKSLSQSVSLVAQSCPTLCDPMNHNTPGLPVHHQLPEFTQTHVHQVGEAIQPSHPLSSPSSPAPNPSQHQGLFQRVSSSHQVAKVLEFQLQHQSLQWNDFL